MLNGGFLNGCPLPITSALLDLLDDALFCFESLMLPTEAPRCISCGVIIGHSAVFPKKSESRDSNSGL